VNRKPVDRLQYLDSLPWIDRPQADIDAYVDRLSEDAGFDLRAKLKEWQARGVVVFENVVDRSLVDALLGDLEYLKRHHKDFELSVELRGEHRDIATYSREDLTSDGIKFNCLHSISRAACLLSLNRHVMTFLRHVFGAAPCVLQSLTFYKGSQQPAHIDYPYVRSQTRLAHLAASWTPLEDVHPDSGPLAYYPGSHDPKISGFFDWGGGSVVLESDSNRTPVDFSAHLEQRMRAIGIAPQVFLPKVGDVLIWHGNLTHEGSKVNNPALTRKSYVTHFTCLDAYPRDFMKPGAIERGECIARDGGYVFFYPWVRHPAKLPSWMALR
jgi:phytanoyl-CoA hydroxylase